jgi:type IV pilus assembly protein PilE
MRTYSRPSAGFTLIELLIAVAVVGILATVALPSYQDYIRRSKRADGRALIQTAAFAQERYRLNNTSYASVTAALSGACSTGSTPGACYSQQGNYTLSITSADATSFTLTAAAATASQLADRGCTSLVYTKTGSTVTTTPSDCWSK